MNDAYTDLLRVANSFLLLRPGPFMFDIDGVLCPDPPVMEEKAQEYRRYLQEAPPLFVPQVPAHLATARLEKYRPETEKWLRGLGVKIISLSMAPFKTPQERRKVGNWKSKAVAYRDSPCRLMIESDGKQAVKIATLSGKAVLAVDSPRFIPARK